MLERVARKRFKSVEAMLAFFRKTGSEGGKKAAARMSAKARHERARTAAAASAKVRSAKARRKQRKASE